MGYYSELSIDTRTCGQADEDAYLDRRDGLRPMTRARVFEALETQRWQTQQAAREGAARLPYLSHGARFDRMVSRYAVAKREGRERAAAAIKRAANRIVDEMPR